jgi:acyl dehydratase
MTDFFEDVTIGWRADLGTHTFTADEIKTFARAFDPQPFHLDEAAAERSLFGGLSASGWHTAAIWMRLMVGFMRAHAARMRAEGKPLARPGPSPGFRQMRWLKPVFAGDTIAYTLEVTGKVDLKSKPDWGLIVTRNEGHNQRGELVFSFVGQVLFERRTPFQA